MYSHSMPTRIAVLASGEGTNAQAILDAAARDELAGAQVAVIVTDRPHAHALDRARETGVEAVFLDPVDYGGRAAYGEALAQELTDREIDLVCLAGFMRVLAPSFVKPFENRVLNIHPALLPAFPGARAVREALEWGVKVTGVTVHFVDEELDHGPIILQEAVEVLPDDNEASLHERIKKVEHRLYPEAIRAVVSGKVRVQGRKVLVTA